MKTRSAIIALLAIFLSSSCNESNSTTSQTEPVEKKELQVTKPVDSIGEVLFTIDFKLKATGEALKTYTDGFIPWVSVDKAAQELKQLVDADKIVLPFQKVKLVIDYPLNIPASFVINTSKQGFSRKDLVIEISKRYHELYAEEERTATTKTVAPDKREGLENRNQTDGKYGIWGHDIADLDLSEIEVHKNLLGEITLILVIES